MCDCGNNHVNALEIKSGAELLDFHPDTIVIGRTRFTILTGYEKAGSCFWCGAEVKSPRRYCKGHRTLYYQHFDWGEASRWALKRADRRCDNCHKTARELPLPKNTYLHSCFMVHHIVPVNGAGRQFTAYNLPWNLVVLCHECHLAVHAAMRDKPAVVERAQLQYSFRL